MSGFHLYHKPRRRKKIGPEACLQMAVVEHLRLVGVPGLLFHSIPNEGKRSTEAALYLKRLGMLPGAGDLTILIPQGPRAYLELKAKGEKQSPEQLAFELACKDNGTLYACVDNINDALCVLRYWGALKPDRSVRRAA